MIASQLRTLAATVRDNPSAREAIAAGFELIAAAMDGPPCIDCAAQQHAAAEPDAADMSAGGTD